jgi:hypothetical protein
LRRLDKTARTLGVFFNIHRLLPSACRSAPKARTQHLHWVSAGRVDIPQPAAVVAGDHAGLIQMWEGHSGNGRGGFTNSCAVAPTRRIS